MVVVLRADSSAAEVQAPAVRLRVERTRPVVAARATVVPRLAIAVAGAGEEEDVSVRNALQTDATDAADGHDFIDGLCCDVVPVSVNILCVG